MGVSGFAPALRDGRGCYGRQFPRISSWAIFDSSLRDEGRAPWENGARYIGATRQEVNRITNLKHATKIDRIDVALRALGKRH